MRKRSAFTVLELIVGLIILLGGILTIGLVFAVISIALSLCA
jgi:hypothetical protein